jgi:hypothetical protein
LALALLEHLVPNSAPLAGDLIEEFQRRPSTAWFWWQVLAAIVTVPSCEPDEIRPLRLVELQPLDALERSRRASLHVQPINLSASPFPGVGGLGVVVLAFHMTAVVPSAWKWFLASTLAGTILGLVLTTLRSRQSPSPTGGPVHSLRLR